MLQDILKRLNILSASYYGLLESIQHRGFETAFNKYYGIYPAFVMANNDPEGRGRVQIRSDDVGHTTSIYPTRWTDPSFHGAGQNMGDFSPPEVGDTVWVSFYAGNPSKPNVYFGGWYFDAKSTGSAELPKEFGYSPTGFPERRGTITRAGHALVFVDEPGKEGVRLVWHQPDPGDPSLTNRNAAADRSKGNTAFVSFTKSGIVIHNAGSQGSVGSTITLDSDNKCITLIDENGSTVSTSSHGVQMIDPKGNFIALSDGDITLSCSGNISITGKSLNVKTSSVDLGDGASSSYVKGEAWMALHNSHTHGSGIGPTSTVVVPATPSVLSTVVKGS